jgi:hypothetical protein
VLNEKEEEDEEEEKKKKKKKKACDCEKHKTEVKCSAVPWNGKDCVPSTVLVGCLALPTLRVPQLLAMAVTDPPH